MMCGKRKMPARVVLAGISMGVTDEEASAAPDTDHHRLTHQRQEDRFVTGGVNRGQIRLALPTENASGTDVSKPMSKNV